MSKTADQLTAEEVRHYLAAARKREENRRLALEKRIQRAQSLAQEAAGILRDKYRVQRVVLFGSLTQPDTFTLWSDVDIAAWGLTSENFLQAMNDVASLDSEIEVNLVDMATVKSTLLEHIQRHGQDI
ncbi:MAG: nucleotidyltransferase domain-containing protein [Desulfovermiculus sp.]|nr:nucleotidyltransferase domain-containing protein [Desulfovermiculus sp.]